MTQYIVCRLTERLAASFNEAAKILEDQKDVKVLQSSRLKGKTGGAFLIEAPETAINNLRQKLPGWAIGRNTMAQ